MRPLIYIPDGIARIGERRPQVASSAAGQAPMAIRGVATGQAAWVRRHYSR
jgi:hypothetical protein